MVQDVPSFVEDPGRTSGGHPLISRSLGSPSGRIGSVETVRPSRDTLGLSSRGEHK